MTWVVASASASKAQHYVGRPYKTNEATQVSTPSQQDDSRMEFHIFSPPLTRAAVRELHGPTLLLMGLGCLLGAAVSLAILADFVVQAHIAAQADGFSDKTVPRLLLGGGVPLYPPLFAPGASLGHNGILEQWWAQADGSPFKGDLAAAQGAAAVGAAAAQAGTSRAINATGVLLALLTIAYVALVVGTVQCVWWVVLCGRLVLLLSFCFVCITPPSTLWLLKGLLLDVPLLLLASRVQRVTSACSIRSHPLTDRFGVWVGF